MKYKNFQIPDDFVESTVNKLGVSMIDACEMYLSDNELIKDKTVEELSNRANKNRITVTIHEAQKAKEQRKARARKENPLKKEIIQAIFAGIAENINTDGEIVVTNDEKYIDFNVNNREFTINLVEHRPKKTK